jgi:membrane protease YdiL (CAAX protease family)
MMESTHNSVPPPLHGEAQVRFPRLGVILALAVIVSCVVFVVRRTAQTKALQASASVSQNPVFDMMARYSYGFRMLMSQSGQWNPKLAESMETSLGLIMKTPADRFRIEILRGMLHDRWPSEEALNAVKEEAPQLERDCAVLRELENKGRNVSKEDWQWFSERHGWMARLARVQALPHDDPEWKALSSEGAQVVAVLGLGVMLLMLAFLVGLILFVLTILRWRQGRLPVVINRPSAGWGGSLVEGFALYVCAWTVLPAFLRWIFPSLPHWSFYVTGAIFVAIAMFWPRWRGVPHAAWKSTLGLNTGKGIRREMAAGVLGWMAMLPVLAACMFLAQIIARHTNEDMQHPILQQFARPGWAQLGAVMLASLWAPLVEETMFRGLLFPGLSAFARWVMGAFSGAFIFAVVHPQGWAAVPAIMTIALMASTLRLTRGSLIAPMTAHALNNGLIVTLLVLVSR